jgi:large subunit ribosomal protein L29
MKIKDIRELSREELEARKRELKQEIFHLRIQQQSGQLEKPSLIRSLRREVARVETVSTAKAQSAAAK